MSKSSIIKTGVKLMSNSEFDKWKKDNKYCPPSRTVAEMTTHDGNRRTVKIVLQEDGQLYYIYVNSKGETFGKHYYINDSEFQLSGTGRVSKKGEEFPVWLSKKDVRKLYCLN